MVTRILNKLLRWHSGPEKAGVVSSSRVKATYQVFRRPIHSIYYLSTDRKLMAAAVGPGPSFGVPKALFQTRVAETVTGYRTHYFPARDGQRFLITMRTTDPPQASITVVVNWQAGLKK